MKEFELVFETTVVNIATATLRLRSVTKVEKTGFKSEANK